MKETGWVFPFQKIGHGFQVISGGLRDLRSLEKATQIKATQIKAPTGKVYQKYVYNSCMVKGGLISGLLGSFGSI